MTPGREHWTPRCPLSSERSGALKGEVGGVTQGQSQVPSNPNDTVTIGCKPLANFQHRTLVAIWNLQGEQNLGSLHDYASPPFPSVSQTNTGLLLVSPELIPD